MRKRIRFGRLPLLLYALALAVWLVLCGAQLGGDLFARARGRMPQQEMDIAQAELYNLLPLEDGWLADTPDPQIIWRVPEKMKVRTVTLWAEFPLPYGEMTLYYTTAPGEDFSIERRVYAHDNGDGSYTFTLPQSSVYALRMDPCCVICKIGRMRAVWNTPCPLWRYFCPNGVQIFWMVLTPAMVASVLCVAQEMYRDMFGELKKK